MDVYGIVIRITAKYTDEEQREETRRFVLTTKGTKVCLICIPPPERLRNAAVRNSLIPGFTSETSG